MGEPTFDIPAEGIAGVVRDEGDNFWVEVVKKPVPECGPDDVLVRLNATGLCMSDIHYMMQDWKLNPKMSEFGTTCPGHEGAGVIVKVGANVKGLKVGQRAGHKPLLDVCHQCEACKEGKDSYCLQAISTGLHRDGSYQQYVTSPARYITLIPDGVSDYVAGPVMCSAATIYSSIKTAALKPGNWAVFPGGGGGVGIQGVQLAAAMGLRAIVVDTGAEREKLTKSYGAEHFFDFRTCDPVAEVLKATDGGAHAVFVTAVQAYPIALKYLGNRRGGQVMCIGLPPTGEFHIDLDPTNLVFRNQSIKGTLVSSLGEIDETLAFAARGKLHLEPKIIGLSQWNEYCQKLKRSEVAGRVVVDFNIP